MWLGLNVVGSCYSSPHLHLATFWWRKLRDPDYEGLTNHYPCYQECTCLLYRDLYEDTRSRAREGEGREGDRLKAVLLALNMKKPWTHGHDASPWWTSSLWLSGSYFCCSRCSMMFSRWWCGCGYCRSAGYIKLDKGVVKRVAWVRVGGVVRPFTWMAEYPRSPALICFI